LKFWIADCRLHDRPIAHHPIVAARSLPRRHLASATLASLVAASLCLLVAATVAIATTQLASAQGFSYNPLPPRPRPPRVANDGQMLVQAVEVDYDYNNSLISAVGNVQLFYNGTSVEADKVIYDQKTKRLHAEGNIRMTDADGKITYANIMDLSDDYRDGFVDSLRVDTEDQTRMAATRADRTSGNYTVFENGVYTACAPCRDDPKKPPLWQSRAPASSTIRWTRCCISKRRSSNSSAFRSPTCRISRRPIRP
jgi:LPS-assembly protein